LVFEKKLHTFCVCKTMKIAECFLHFLQFFRFFF